MIIDIAMVMRTLEVDNKDYVTKKIIQAASNRLPKEYIAPIGADPEDPKYARFPLLHVSFYTVFPLDANFLLSVQHDDIMPLPDSHRMVVARVICNDPRIEHCSGYVIAVCENAVVFLMKTGSDFVDACTEPYASITACLLDFIELSGMCMEAGSYTRHASADMISFSLVEHDECVEPKQFLGTLLIDGYREIMIADLEKQGAIMGKSNG